MQTLSSLFSRAALTITAALALGACSRSEYAMLPRSASYLGTTPVASVPRPTAPAAARPEAAASVAPAAAPVAAPSQAVAVAPAVAAPVRPAAPVATPAPAEAATVVSAAPAKPSLMQRLALKKINKQLTKLAARSPQFKQHDATASTARLDSNLRTGLIFLLVGLLVSLFAGVAGIFGVIGAILAIIGLVFIILWLLDQA